MTDEPKITSRGIWEKVEDKFVVIKKADLAFLPHFMKKDLEIILDEIGAKRFEQGKKNNNYLVINVDEPYAEEVLLVMRKHGHCKPEYSLKDLEDDRFECLEGHTCQVNCYECPLSKPKDTEEVE